MACSGDVYYLQEFLETQRTWNIEAVDLLLEFWAGLLTESLGRGPRPLPPNPMLCEGSAVLYRAMVVHRIEMAAAVVAMGEDDDNPWEDVTQLQEHVRTLCSSRCCFCTHCVMHLHVAVLCFL